jgi:drug/metabolite transporter (DMT)-like permease
LNGVSFALLSLVCAGLTDVVFKRYARLELSRGAFVLGMGLTWSAIQASILLLSDASFRVDLQAVQFGLAAGLLVAVSNTLLIEGLRHVDIGIGSTIYRLNTVAVVAMAALFLGEALTPLKLTGIGLGVGAILLLLDRKPAGSGTGRAVSFVGLLIVASLLRACFGILSKVAALHHVHLGAMLFVNAQVWIAVGAAYSVFRPSPVAAAAATVRYAILSGALICGVANFLMLAVERGQASVVVPIANMSFVVALLFSAALGMERLTGRKLLAVAMAAGAIVALAAT